MWALVGFLYREITYRNAHFPPILSRGQQLNNAVVAGAGFEYAVDAIFLATRC
jgi:hypothetical protein